MKRGNFCQTIMLFAVPLLLPALSYAQVTAVRFGRLIDGQGKVLQNAVIVVEGERIAKVGAGDAAVPPNAKVIDLRRYTAIPGLIDVHTHTYEEMKAAADVAHQAGKRIAIHSYGPDAARDAVRAGADSVEHATDMDEATLKEMVRRGAFYVPTVDHNRYYIAHKDEFGYDQAVDERRACRSG